MACGHVALASIRRCPFDTFEIPYFDITEGSKFPLKCSETNPTGRAHSAPLDLIAGAGRDTPYRTHPLGAFSAKFSVSTLAPSALVNSTPSVSRQLGHPPPIVLYKFTPMRMQHSYRCTTDLLWRRLMAIG
jgi:hypothetical protein